MKFAIRKEIFCYGFPCKGCPFDDFGQECRLVYAEDKTVFMLAGKSNRFNKYLDRAKKLGIKPSGGVVLK